MSIVAVTVFVASGAILGAVASVRALRSGTTNPGALAFCGMGAVAITRFLMLQHAFWSGLAAADPYQTFAPDFFTPVRRDRILWWYGVASAGVVTIVVAGWARFRLSRQKA